VPGASNECRGVVLRLPRTYPPNVPPPDTSFKKLRGHTARVWIDCAWSFTSASTWRIHGWHDGRELKPCRLRAWAVAITLIAGELRTCIVSGTSFKALGGDPGASGTATWAPSHPSRASDLMRRSNLCAASAHEPKAAQIPVISLAPAPKLK